MLGALQQATLAEAQAVMADRAEVKGTAPSLVAALHCGAAGIYVPGNVGGGMGVCIGVVVWVGGW